MKRTTEGRTWWAIGTEFFVIATNKRVWVCRANPWAAILSDGENHYRVDQAEINRRIESGQIRVIEL